MIARFDDSHADPDAASASPSGKDAAAEAWAGLMQAAQLGDAAAYYRLLRELVPVIRRLVAKRIFDPATVEDVTQDVLISLHQVRHTFDPQRPFLPWLSAIVQARAVDALRRWGRRARWEVEEVQGVEQHPDLQAEHGLRALEQRQEVRQLLHRLSPRQRRLVEMVHLEQLSLSDAARTSRLSLSAVKSILYRALQNLKHMTGTPHE